MSASTNPSTAAERSGSDKAAGTDKKQPQHDMTNPLLVLGTTNTKYTRENTMTKTKESVDTTSIEFVDSVFDKYARLYKESDSTAKVLKYDDFATLLSSDELQHNDLVYLSKIASYIPFDISKLLYTLNDSNNKGYISKSDFENFSLQLLLPNQKSKATTTENIADTFKHHHNDLDLDINKLLFFVCKKYETSTSSQSNIYNLDTSLSKERFLSLVEEHNLEDLKYINSLLYETGKSIDFVQFANVMDELPRLKLKYIFSTAQNANGHITPDQLKQITQNIFYNKLSPKVADHLELFALNKYGNEINYEDTFKTIKMIRDLPKLNYLTFEKATNDESHNPKFYLTSKSLYTYINDNSLTHNITKDEIVLYFNWNRFTHEHIKSHPTIDPTELLAVLTDDMVIPNENINTPTSTTSSSDNNFTHLFTSIHNFILGSFAGMIGATLVYPIDIVKTRMQNQKNNSVYSSYSDCFRKLVRNEGILGLYSGLLPQVVGVAPEKAIKLVLNDLVRNFGKKQSKNGDITLTWEVLAGTTAGFCQVVVTNPLEVSKIRLQTQGEYIKQLRDEGKIINPKTAVEVVRELGFKGLYRGAGACLLRDIPFSGIYFPAYANIKKLVFGLDPGKPGKRSNLEPWELLLSGAVAGMPAAFLTTPCDVIKTRIQTKPALGQEPYLGIVPTFKRIMAEEGPKAFFKGGFARICRSSPQFGFTLAAYELFQKTLPLDLFYGTSSKDKDSLTSSSFSISEHSKRFKLSSSASSADLNPTLLALTNYYKFIEKDSKNDTKK